MLLEKEKEISKETLFEAIENSLLTACKNHFGKADNIKVEHRHEIPAISPVYAEKEVVPTAEDVEDDCLQISLEDAKKIDPQSASVGDIDSRGNQVQGVRTNRNPECKERYSAEDPRGGKKRLFIISTTRMEKEVVTGVVQRYVGQNVSINLGKADAMLNESEMVKGEVFKPTERIKVYILEVKNTHQGATYQCKPYPSGAGKEIV